MGLFDFGKKKDEYDYIYGNGDDSDIDYSEVDGYDEDGEDEEEVIENLRGTIESGDCIYCGGKNAMRYEGGICFECSKCGNSVHEDTYYRWAAGYQIEFDGEYFGDPSYEAIYDEGGYSASVECDACRTEIRWKDGQYICPNCGEVMSREEFFNCIGVEPPGKECITCSGLYPGCTSCQHGYIKDENE